MAEEGRAGRYVVFQLGKQYFAVRADLVRAVVSGSSITACSPGNGAVCGSVNLGGRVLPVIDIRSRLGLRPRRPGPCAAVIVLNLGKQSVAIEADVLSEVLEVRDRDFRDGVIQLRYNGRPYGRPKVVVEPESLFKSDEIDALPWTA